MTPEQFHDIYYALPEAMLLVSLDGKVLATNPAVSNVLALKPAQVIHYTLNELVLDDADKVSQYVRSCGKSRNFVAGTLTWRNTEKKEGIKCHCSGALLASTRSTSQPLLVLRCTNSGTIKKSFSVLDKELDALRRKHRQVMTRAARLEQYVEERTEALSKSETFLRAVLQTAADAIISIDQQGVIQSFNAAAENIFHYQASEIVGQNIAKLMPEGIAQGHDNHLRHYQKTGKKKIIDGGAISVSGKRKDDSLFPLEVAISELWQGEQRFYIGILRDVTKKKQAMDELTRANKELDQFAHITSHDLKAPLRAIANLSEWIQEDSGDELNEDSRNNLVLLRQRVKRMEDLIDGILQYSRVGRIRADIQQVNINTLLEDIIDSQAPGDDVKINIKNTLPNILTPKVKLSQVFANLISNAIKYSDKAHTIIDISSIEQNDFYEFRVTDNGPGIAPQHHESAFQMFHTLHSRDDVDSTGVGLTLVKKIVDEINGTVRIKSDIGQGATFSFTWPKDMQPNDS